MPLHQQTSGWRAAWQHYRVNPTYRMYVDENGNADLGASTNPNHRYLALTGVICGFDNVAAVIGPELEPKAAAVVVHLVELLRKKRRGA